MGSYTFKWASPTADTSDVLVTGSFDGWTKSVQLEKKGDVFEKTVQFPDKIAASKIYYKFVVDNNWTINESYPHEPDHEGNINNFLTPNDLANSTQSASIATTPFLNSVTPESTTVTDMAKKGNKKNSNKAAAANKQLPADSQPSGTAVAAAVAATSPAAAAQSKEPIATPSDVPGGFPVTPANEDTKLEDKPVSINPLPATAGLGNPIKLAPGEKIPKSITSQDVNQHVKLDKESYEKSDALPPAPALDASASAALPPAAGPFIPESSLPIGSKNTEVVNPAINSTGPNATTAALAGEVPLESKVPKLVKESQEKAGVSPEASAVPSEVKEKGEVEKEIKAKIPEAPATSVGTSGIGTEKKENTGTIIGAAAAAGGAAIAAAGAAATKFSDDATPALVDAKNAAASALNNTLPDSVKDRLPVAAQDALASGNKVTPLDKVSPQVPSEVKDSIAEAGKSPEAASSTAAVQDKAQVETELLKEVKAAPAIDEIAKDSTPKIAAGSSAATKTAEAETKPSTAAATSTGDGDSKTTESVASASAANGNGTDSKSVGTTGDKKKHRLSAMFSKLKAKLK